MSDDSAPQSVPELKIVWSTQEQVERGRTAIERYAAGWKASPALLVIKPYLALIVSLKDIQQDERHFALTLVAEQVIVAPKDFDREEPIVLTCVWNQPFMDLHRDLINAPYSFYLHFGAEGVQEVREFTQNERFSRMPPELVMGALRGLFLKYSDGMKDYAATYRKALS